MLEFQVNFSKVFVMLSSNDRSNWTLSLHSIVLHVDHLLRDKPLKTAFGSSEKP